MNGKNLSNSSWIQVENFSEARNRFKRDSVMEEFHLERDQKVRGSHAAFPTVVTYGPQNGSGSHNLEGFLMWTSDTVYQCKPKVLFNLKFNLKKNRSKNYRFVWFILVNKRRETFFQVQNPSWNFSSWKFLIFFSKLPRKFFTNWLPREWSKRQSPWERLWEWTSWECMKLPLINISRLDAMVKHSSEIFKLKIKLTCDSLYYMSGVATGKFVRQYLQVGRMDVVLTHLRSALFHPAGIFQLEINLKFKLNIQSSHLFSINPPWFSTTPNSLHLKLSTWRYSPISIPNS